MRRVWERRQLPLRYERRWKQAQKCCARELQLAERGIPGEREVTQEEVLGQTWIEVGRG